MESVAKLQLISLEDQIIDKSLKKLMHFASSGGATQIGRPKKEQLGKGITLWGATRRDVKVRSVQVQGTKEELKTLLHVPLPQGVYIRLTLDESKKVKS